MSDIELVIKIPEETYKGIMLGKWDGNGLAYYVKVGTPLPKGHGRLKDVDWIYEHTPSHWDDEDGSRCVTWEEIYDAPTIIEADEIEEVEE